MTDCTDSMTIKETLARRARILRPRVRTEPEAVYVRSVFSHVANLQWSRDHSSNPGSERGCVSCKAYFFVDLQG